MCQPKIHFAVYEVECENQNLVSDLIASKLSSSNEDEFVHQPATPIKCFELSIRLELL
jgi:hypothetical protein